jgi:hypothetical protein
MDRKSFVTGATLVLIFVFCIGAINYARHQEKATCSYEKTSDTAICDGAAVITDILVITGGTGKDAKLIVYDDPDDASSGNVMAEITVIGADNYGRLPKTSPVWAKTGIYCDITGTDASFVIDYIPL